MSTQPPEEPPAPMKTIVQHLYDEINRLSTEGSERITVESPPVPTSGAGASGAGGGGTEFLDWGSITNKPTNLFAKDGNSDSFAATQSLPSGIFAEGGDSDGFTATQALANADVTAALDLSSAPFLDITSGTLTARVKDEDDFASNSATDLATQQSIKSYVDNNVAPVTVDFGDDGTDIDPLEQITVTGDESDVFSKGAADGEMDVDMSDVAILTETETFEAGLRVTGGKLGVQNTSPDYALDVDGDGRFTGTIRNDWTDLQNVSITSVKNAQIGSYDNTNAEWVNRFVSDIIRERGSLSIGDVTVAGSWKTIESPTKPTQRPNGDSLQEGDVWIDTDASPSKGYVYRNGSFVEQATSIGGDQIVTGGISAQNIEANTITAGEIDANAITTEELTAGAAKIGNVLVGGNNVTRSDTAPTNPSENDIWIDTSLSPPTSKYWDGASWVQKTFISGELISTNTLTSDQIRADAITTNELEANSVTSEVVETGAVDVGSLAIASAGNTTQSDRKPEPSDGQGGPNGDPLQDGHVWVHVFEENGREQAQSYVWQKEKGEWKLLQQGFAGGLLQSESIFSDKISAGTITANEISSGTITAEEINTGSLSADTAFISDLEAEIFQSGEATITNLLQVGSGDPHVLIDGQNSRIESSNYASGVEGFRVGADGFAEFENGRFRGELRSTVVKKEEVTAVGGRDMVAAATRLAPELRIKQISQSGQDLSIKWDDNGKFLNRDLIVESTSQNGEDLQIEWGGRTKTIAVRDDLFSVGEKIRMKDGQEGGREYIGTITGKQDLENGTLLELDNYITEKWPQDTVVASFTDRVEHVADGEFAPYTSYVLGDEEVARIGNIQGVVSGEGNGIVIGDSDLVYSTETERLAVQGRVVSTSGQIGGLTIQDGSLRSESMLLDTQPSSDDFLGFTAPGGTILNSAIESRDFNSSSGWTQVRDNKDYQPNVDGGEIEVNNSRIKPEYSGYDYSSANDNYEHIWKGIIEQTVDFSAANGKVVTFEFAGDVGYNDFVFTVTDENKGEEIYQEVINDDVLKVDAQMPNDASTITLRIRLDRSNYTESKDNIPDTDIPKLDYIEAYVGGVFTKLDKSGFETFDDNFNKTTDIDRLNGAFTAKDGYYFTGGGGVYKNSNGEVVAEDDAGNTYTLT